MTISLELLQDLKGGSEKCTFGYCWSSTNALKGSIIHSVGYYKQGSFIIVVLSAALAAHCSTLCWSFNNELVDKQKNLYVCYSTEGHSTAEQVNTTYMYLWASASHRVYYRVDTK